MDDIKKEDRLDKIERAVERLLRRSTDPPDEAAEGGQGQS